jgi:hypothetical protein
MSIPITNAKDRPLNQNVGTTPDLSGALLDWFQPMKFILLAKSVQAFKSKQFQNIPINTMGHWQPFQPRTLDIKQEGQRSWKWFRMYCFPGTGLDVDFIITYQGQNYRIMFINDYSLEGYQEFKLVQDYQCR